MAIPWPKMNTIIFFSFLRLEIFCGDFGPEVERCHGPDAVHGSYSPLLRMKCPFRLLQIFLKH